ncbi:MAG: hypothetical protein NT154_17560, partial [Verrucomicrobia bacterium]|nr:hypothetical protein [Verrucomicrobiota bacterium]
RGRTRNSPSAPLKTNSLETRSFVAQSRAPVDKFTWPNTARFQLAASARQERLNRAYAKREGIKVLAEYFDEATSVKDGATPLFRKVIAELPNQVGINAA